MDHFKNHYTVHVILSKLSCVPFALNVPFGAFSALPHAFKLHFLYV